MIPGLPGSQVRNDGDVMRMIQDMQRDIRELKAQNVLATAGITTQPGGITVTGTETVTGNLNVSGSETVTGSLDVQGPATFEGTTTIGGNASITGTLSLPAGIIGNDALTSPVFPAAAHADATNFDLATGVNVEKVRATVAVPAGYTKALVMATASMSNQNSNTSADDMYVTCNINGAVSGWAGQETVGPGERGFVMNSASVVLTGLSSSFYIAAKASSSTYAWPANINATTNVDAIVLFLR
jgi:hypothetical protein